MRWLLVLVLALAHAACASAGRGYGVGPQYDTTHVYVPADQLDPFVASFLATFGGETTPRVAATVTPTPSITSTQLLHTPVGPVSLFGFATPVPYPFGAERTGYLVSDLDQAVAAAVAAGASILVAPFPDAIGRDAIVEWPGGVAMQLYTHTTAPSYPALATVPENRVYVAADRADAFTRAFARFAHARVTSDNPRAPGQELGRQGWYRRIRIESAFGKLVVIATDDGRLPFPYGRELTGYEVPDLAATVAKATASGAKLLVPPVRGDDRDAAMVEFPGGYIAEIHAPLAAAKHISLRHDDPNTYLSLGLTLRERFEASDVVMFGVATRASDIHDLQRLQVHADLHVDAWNLFVQLEDVRAFAKAPLGPADENPVDLRQAFVMYRHALGDGTFAIELVHSIAGHAIRAAGGTDSNYGALEARLSW